MGIIKTLEILAPGPLTTVQDLGRFGFGRFGVPQSGAADPFSLRIGNILVGNPENAAALELTFMGPKIRILENSVIAITGADLQPAVDGESIPMWQSRLMKTGNILSFKGRGTGCRAYLSVSGGISVPIVMGSRSTNLTARFGGLDGRPLAKGDVLCTESPTTLPKREKTAFDSEMIPVYSAEQRLRIIPGPQNDHFPDMSWRRFLNSLFTVTPDSNRAGARLSGPSVWAGKELDASILSEGVVPGAIQVPGDAQPIILLGEAVTGGYRKIATVISADLHLAGQLTPGDIVQFKEVTMKRAGVLRREMEELIARFRMEAAF
jgi:antagonist of KipI